MLTDSDECSASETFSPLLLKTIRRGPRAAAKKKRLEVCVDLIHFKFIFIGKTTECRLFIWGWCDVITCFTFLISFQFGETSSPIKHTGKLGNTESDEDDIQHVQCVSFQ